MRHYKTCRECPLICAVRRYRGTGEGKDCPPLLCVFVPTVLSDAGENVVAETPKEAALLWAADFEDGDLLGLSYRVCSRKLYEGDPVQITVREMNGSETRFSLGMTPTFYVEPSTVGLPRPPKKKKKSAPEKDPTLAAHGLMVAQDASVRLSKESVARSLLPVVHDSVGIPPPKKRKIHLRWGGGPLCNFSARQNDPELTEDESEVTCSKCRHKIGISDAPRAQ